MTGTELVGLFDRDVFLKLICCDLWQDTISALGISSAMRLPSTSSVKASAKNIDRWLPGEAERIAVRERLSGIIAAVPVIDEKDAQAVEASALYAEMASRPDIDAGEALLVGLMQIIAQPNVILTGDKRFVTALRTEFPELFAQIEARIVTFEFCLRKICESQGANYVIDRVRKASNCDKVIGLALGSNSVTDEISFQEALRSFDPSAISKIV